MLLSKHKTNNLNAHNKRSKGEKGQVYVSFRHRFAAHLLERGVDLRYIRELFGYRSSKTGEEIYTYVSNRDIGKIKSPLDMWGGKT